MKHIKMNFIRKEKDNNLSHIDLELSFSFCMFLSKLLILICIDFDLPLQYLSYL